MKWAISNIAWSLENEDELLSIFKNLNISGIEIAPTIAFGDLYIVNDQQIHAYRHKWESRGFQLIAMQALLFGQPQLQLFGTPGQVQEFKDYFKMVIAIAGKLEIPVMVFGSPKNRLRGEISHHAAVQHAIPIFQELGDVAMRHRTQLCIEANPREYGGDFILSLADAIDLVQQVNHPGFGLHLDTGEQILQPELPMIPIALEHSKHFHVSEPFLAPITDHPLHQQLGSLLQQSRYTHFVSLEMRKPAEQELSTIEQSLHRLQQQYGN